MPFRIERNDIAEVKADCIVNTADPEPIVGWGTDSAVHRKAGPALLRAREKIGYIAPGHARETPAFGLDAKYVMHTVSPVWTGGRKNEERILRRAYDTALSRARELGCESIAFPLMAAGNLGFPRHIALKVAVDAFTDFLMKYDMDIILVVFDQSVYRLSRMVLDSVESFIDENYIDAAIRREYSSREIMEINDSLSENPDWVYLEEIRRGMQGSDRLQDYLDRMLEDYPLLSRVLDGGIEDEQPEEYYSICDDPDDDLNERRISRILEAEARKLSADQERRGRGIEEEEDDGIRYQTLLPDGEDFEEDGISNILFQKEEAEEPFSGLDGSFGAPESAKPRQSLKELEGRPVPEDAGKSGCASIVPEAGKETGEPDLSELMSEIDAGFSDTLRTLINASGSKPSDIYKRANIDRKLFSKIMSTPFYQPSKPTAIAFALALHLDFESTEDLIRRAGYAFTHASYFDIIVEWAIKNHRYNIIELNTVLFDYDQPLIGSGRDR